MYSEDRLRTIVREEIAASNDILQLKQEVYRLGILFEEMNTKLDALLELIADTLGISKRVTTHEARISDSEDAVIMHSKQFKSRFE